MKKFLLILVFITIIGSGTAFADHPNNKLGLGIMGTWQANWGGGWYGGPALSLKVPKVPIFWAINLSFSQHHFNVGLSGDYYFIDKVLFSEAFLHWYLGVGGWFSFGTWGENSASIGLGGRLPIGLSFQPLKELEIFLEVAPSLGLNLVPLYFPAGGFPVSLGIRFWM
jgi:hypothetical protein